MNRILKLVGGVFERLAAAPTSADHIRYATETLRREGVTCYCSGLAIPTGLKGRKYRCVKCDKVFAHAFYNLGNTRNRRATLNLNYYLQAVSLLEKEYE